MHTENILSDLFFDCTGNLREIVFIIDFVSSGVKSFPKQLFDQFIYIWLTEKKEPINPSATYFLYLFWGLLRNAPVEVFKRGLTKRAVSHIFYKLSSSWIVFGLVQL